MNQEKIIFFNKEFKKKGFQKIKKLKIFEKNLKLSVIIQDGMNHLVEQALKH